MFFPQPHSTDDQARANQNGAACAGKNSVFALGRAENVRLFVMAEVKSLIVLISLLISLLLSLLLSRACSHAC